MAIFIQGKTTCRLCGSAIERGAEMVGLPHMPLPSGFQDLGNSCLHRRCLDAHPMRADFVQAWQQHWRAQATAPGVKASVSPHGVAIFISSRFVFAAAGSFVTFEEATGSFEALRGFFKSFDGSRQACVVAAWNTYEATPTPDGVRLLVTDNPPPPGVQRVSQDPLLVDAGFTHARWGSLARAWTHFTRA